MVLLAGDWLGEVAVAYRSLGGARTDAAGWPAALLDAVRSYTPATDIIFLRQHDGAGTLVGMRTVPPRLTPQEAGQHDGGPALVPSA